MIENVANENQRQNIFFPGPINEKQADDRFPASMIPIHLFLPPVFFFRAESLTPCSENRIQSFFHFM